MTPELLELVKKEAEANYPTMDGEVHLLNRNEIGKNIAFTVGCSFLHGLMEKEIERLKGLMKIMDMRWHNLFYQTTTTMTQKQLFDTWQEHWDQFCKDNNL